MNKHQSDRRAEVAETLRRIAELHPGVLSVSGLGAQPERCVAAVEATPDPQPTPSVPARTAAPTVFERMSSWLRRYVPIA